MRVWEAGDIGGQKTRSGLGASLNYYHIEKKKKKWGINIASKKILKY